MAKRVPKTVQEVPPTNDEIWARWEEFRTSGLLWWINRMLHLFGWAIVLAYKEPGQLPCRAYPIRLAARGFAEKDDAAGYVKLTRHLNRNIKQLLRDVKS